MISKHIIIFDLTKMFPHVQKRFATFCGTASAFAFYYYLFENSHIKGPKIDGKFISEGILR